MAIFALHIDTDNAAFDDDPSHEVARILREAATAIERGTRMQRLADINGNTVGRYRFKGDE